jgi:hypothetical protein
LPPDAPITVNVVVNRSQLPTGLNVGRLRISSGESVLLVTVEAIGTN